MMPGLRPPAFARWLVSLVCPADDRAFVISDLDEDFRRVAASDGPARARRWYRGQVARSVGPLLSRRLRESLVSGSRHSAPRGRRSVAHGLADIGADVSFALRSLRRDPVVVLITLGSIGLGVGIVSTVFAVAHSLVLRPPGAVEDPDGLVAIHTTEPGGSPFAETSFLDFVDIDREVDAFSRTAAWRAGGLTLTDEQGERRMLVEIVTEGYFDVLGVSPALGRWFSPEETRIGNAAPVVVISHALWVDRFGADRSVLGRTVELNDGEFTVVGVAPEALRGRFLEMRVDAWVPVGIAGGTSRSTELELARRGDRDYSVLARLAPGVSLDQAAAQLESLASRLREEHPEVWAEGREVRGFTVLMGEDARLPPEGRMAMLVAALTLMAGAGLVLLIACTNVAGLFLARGDRRAREIAVRLSMGASRRRILRLLAVESAVLALGAGIVSVGITTTVASMIRRLSLPLDIPIAFAVEVDPAVAGFALAVACATSLAFGLLPALGASRPNVVPALKAGRWTDLRPAGRRIGLRQALVAMQVAGSLMLLVGTGLVLRSLDAASAMDIGLRPDGIAVASVNVSTSVESEGPQRVDELMARLLDDPAVADVAASTAPDGSWMFSDLLRARVEIPGWEAPEGGTTSVTVNAVSAGYFELMGIPVLRGRSIDGSDVAGAPFAAVVTQSFVDRYWDGADPIGRAFRVLSSGTADSSDGTPPRDYVVVGVTRGITFDPAHPPAPALWTALSQASSVEEVVLHAQSRGGAESVVPALRALLSTEGLEPSLFGPQPYQAVIDVAFTASKAASKILAWAGAFTLLLAATGVFGIVSYSVARRSPEMAVRKALGARGGQVVAQVVLDAMFTVMVGVVVGLGLVALTAPLARGALYGLAPHDPAALLGGTAVLLLAALVASWIPARRMATVEAVTALRGE